MLNNCEFSQYYAEFQVIAANLDWIPSALRIAMKSGLSEENKDSFRHTDMQDELPVLVTFCQKQEKQIQQRLVEKADQNKWVGSTGSPTTPKVPAERWQDREELRVLSSAQAGGGYRMRKGQKGLRMGLVYTVVGSTTGR
jgi:hypothetical protein